MLLYGVRDSRLASWGSNLSTHPTAFLTPGQILAQSTGEYRILYKNLIYIKKIYKGSKNGNVLQIFEWEQNYNIFREYEVLYDCWKENLGVGLGFLAAESPARVHCKPESHMLKSQRTETGFLGSGPQGKDGVLPCRSPNTYASPGIQDNWLLANGCWAGLPSAWLWTKLCGADMFATK